MSYPFPPDVEQLIRFQMAAGNYQSEDELLRDALLAFQNARHLVCQEDPMAVEAVRRSLDQMKQGLGRSFDDFDSEFRSRNEIQ